MKTLWLLPLLICLTGCIPFIDHNGPRRKWYYLSDAPPIPREVAQAKSDPAEAVVVVPPQPKTVSLTWSYPPSPDIAFNIYSTQDLSIPLERWPLYRTTQAAQYTEAADDPQRFYAVKAVNAAGLESTWATK